MDTIPFDLVASAASSPAGAVRTIVAVSGEIDVSTAPRLRTGLIELINNGQTDLILDLEGVTFLDSTGLGVLVGALKRVRTVDGSLHLVFTRARLVQIFRIIGLNTVFGIHESVAAAIAAGDLPNREGAAVSARP